VLPPTAIAAVAAANVIGSCSRLKAGCSKVVAAAAKLLPLLLPRVKTVFVLMVTTGAKSVSSYLANYA
jgi:hypothetical protein